MTSVFPTKEPDDVNAERGYEITYHWSPSTRRKAIDRDGLVVGAVPCVNGIDGDDHRNPWISVSPTPSQAWWLSAEALLIGGFVSESAIWDLYEVDIAGLSVERGQHDYPEFRVREDVAADRVKRVATRKLIRHDNNRYTNHGCRCAECKADHAAVKRDKTRTDSRPTQPPRRKPA